MKRILHTAVLAACLLTSYALPSSAAHAADTYTAKVYANSLNVRSEPAASAAITGSLAGGAVVTVTEEQHGWLKVRAGSVSGWVAGYYLKRTSRAASAGTSSASTSVKTSSTSSGTAVVTASSLRIRGGPGTSYEVVGSLQSGNAVTILLRQDGWSRIRTAGGTTGWVSTQYLAGEASRT